MNYVVLANRMNIPRHEFYGYEYVPAFMVDDEMMILEAEPSEDTSKPTQDLLAGER